MQDLKLVHLIGIGGAGMSSLALFLHEQGYRVSGSDISENKNTKTLSEKGIIVTSYHSVDNIRNQDFVVYSSAIGKDNVEFKEAKAKRLRIMHRAEMLAYAISTKERIIVSGTHGKTTTASLITSLLFLCGKNPSFVIGGEIIKAKTNANYTTGDSVVIEADESDGSLKSFCADIGVVTNIEEEHFDYYESKEQIEQVFIDTINGSSKDAFWLCCYEDKDLKRLTANIDKKIIGYGFADNAYVKALNIKIEKGFTYYDYYEGDKFLGTIKTNIMGRHNILNSLPAVYIALYKGVSFSVISENMTRISGIGRRMEIKFVDNEKVVIDDYAHHPTEVEATIAAIRDIYGDRRIVCVFQPHRYSRMLRFENDFAVSFNNADKLYVLNIYSAGEMDSGNISSNSLAMKIKNIGNVKEVISIASLEEVVKAVKADIKKDDVICFMGAGDVTYACESLAFELNR